MNNVLEQALEALEESHALNVNWVSVAEPEMLSHLSEYRVVIKMGEEAIASLKEAIKTQGEPVAEVVSRHSDDSCYSRNGATIIEAELLVDLPVGTKLYTSAPTIPEGWQLVPHGR